ncbi:MAG: hypothetical protein K6C97_08870 [Treponema sp.]|nr:hypothetical protein [Treponema sp.]
MNIIKIYKSYILIVFLLLFSSLFIACTSTKLNNENIDIEKYMAHSEEECSFAFEFINRSVIPLTIYAYIGDIKKMNKDLSFVTKTQDIVIQPGKTIIFNINADLLVKDFNRKYSVGINCYKKNWHWWYTIEKDMKFKRVRIIVDNDYNEGGRMLYPPFENQNKFSVREAITEYENQQYYMYYVSDTPLEYGVYFETTLFYKKEDKRASNLYKDSCLTEIEEMLDKGDFVFIKLNGYDYIMLNSYPLDKSINIDIPSASDLVTKL